MKKIKEIYQQKYKFLWLFFSSYKKIPENLKNTLNFNEKNVLIAGKGTSDCLR